MQVVRGVDPEVLTWLLDSLHIVIEGQVGKSRDRLFLNFTTLALAQQAASSLQNQRLIGSAVSASMKNPAGLFSSSPGAPGSGAKTTSESQLAHVPDYSSAAAGLPAAASSNFFSADCTVVLELAEGTSADMAHKLSGAWQQRGEFSAFRAIQTLERNQRIYINFATAKQAVAAADKFNEGIITRYLDTHVIARAVVKSVFDKSQLSYDAYAADRLLPVDEAYYGAAGLLCLRRSRNGHLKVLLGRQHGRLTLLGGMRNRGESSCLTAMREFSEETSYQLDIGVVAQLIPHASVIWVGGADFNSKYALYILDLDSPSASSDVPVPLAVHEQFLSLCARFAELRSSPAWKGLPSSQREMRALEWVEPDARSVVAVSSSSCSPFLSKLMVECQPLQQWAAYAVQQHAELTHEELPATPSGSAMLQHAAHAQTTSSGTAVQHAQYGCALPAGGRGAPQHSLQQGATVKPRAASDVRTDWADAQHENADEVFVF